MSVIVSRTILKLWVNFAIMSVIDFPVLDNGLFANHAALSPWPRVTAEAVAAFATENAASGSRNFRRWMDREQELREQLAQLLCAPSPRDIALLKNTTEGICAVAWGLPWQAGDNVVLPAGEFPSNRLPWKAQEARGVEVREVDIRAAGDPEAALVSAMDQRTRILAVSSVQYSDGFRLDLEKLGLACEQAGVLFFVDAIQHLGALPIDVVASRIDFLAANGHKWLLAPEGVAVFYSRDSARSQLKLMQQGWHMYDFPWNFSREDWTPSTSARRFEAGSPNSLGQVGLHASLGLILETGMDVISSQVLRNTRKLVAGLRDLPAVQLRSDTRPGRESGIVSFGLPGGNTREAYRRLAEADVTVAMRAESIRLSPHFYQDERVIEQLLGKIESAI